jgi:hypothetical protein
MQTNVPAARRRVPPHIWRWALLCAAVLLLGGLAWRVWLGPTLSIGHHVGDTISNKDVSITLTSVRVLPAGAEPLAPPGDELIVTHVEYVSHVTFTLNFNEVQFIVDPGPSSAMSSVSPQSGTYFTYGRQTSGYPSGYQVPPGGGVASDIVFELPKDAHDARLIFQPDGMDDIAAFWWRLGL